MVESASGKHPGLVFAESRVADLERLIDRETANIVDTLLEMADGNAERAGEALQLIISFAHRVSSSAIARRRVSEEVHMDEDPDGSPINMSPTQESAIFAQEAVSYVSPRITYFIQEGLLRREARLTAEK